MTEPVKEFRISRQELYALPEYNVSLPTGRHNGKRWRKAAYRLRDDNGEPHRDGKGRPIVDHWLIGTFWDDEDDPEMVNIQWQRAVIVNEPDEGPCAADVPAPALIGGTEADGWRLEHDGERNLAWRNAGWTLRNIHIPKVTISFDQDLSLLEARRWAVNLIDRLNSGT